MLKRQTVWNVAMAALLPPPLLLLMIMDDVSRGFVFALSSHTVI